MREPSEGDVVAIPLPDGEYGLAQALGDGLLAFFLARFEQVPAAGVVANLPVAFRSRMGAMVWRDDRWIRVGRAPLRSELTTPFLYWHCGSDFEGYLFEWQHDEPTRELGYVSIDDAFGASVSSLLPITAELWLFRRIEGIEFSPWWIKETDARSIPWSPPRPHDYDLLWAIRFLPNSIDAPARERLDRVWGVGSSDTRTKPRSAVELLEPSMNLIAELYCMPSDEWAHLLREAFEPGAAEVPLGAEPCGHAIAAAYVVGVAGGADVEQGRVPDLVIRVSRKAIKPSLAKTLVPAAKRALDRVLEPTSALWTAVSDESDGAEIVASLRRLRAWCEERG